MKDRTARQIQQGDPRRLGVQPRGNGYNFSLSADREEPLSLLLYKAGEEEPCEEIPVDKTWYVGNVASLFLPDFTGKGYEYNFRRGEEVIQDPYARVITGTGEFGSLPGKDRPHQIRCGFMEEGSQKWEEEPLDTPYSETIMYKVHVRGFTKQKNSGVRHKGTFTGLMEKIPYLKELGITAVELMPAYDFQEIILPKDMPMEYISKIENLPVNYWGYTTGHYFAPKASYCATKDPVAEVRRMVQAFHQAGIECIMEFCFPQGTNPVEVLEVLRFWKLEYHIDGFHLLGDGVPRDLLCSDSLLKKTKLIFQWLPEDAYQGEVSRTRKYLAECNEGFKEDMRRFLKSDEDSLNGAMERIRRNPAEFSVINYITNQDGFTLMDLVSYDSKHNEDNNEENRDGNPFNYSWNCGVEGPSRKLSVRRLREKQMRNAFLFLFLSQGVPLIYGGDEFGNSQNGNNNAYCQDNEIGWIDWKACKRNKTMREFVKFAIAFRKSHGVFHQENPLRIMDYKSLGYPDISYHSQRAWYAQCDNICRYVGMMYCGEYGKNGSGACDDFLYVAYNFHWEPHELALPNLPKKQQWCVVLETGNIAPQELVFDRCEVLTDQKGITVEPRSITILMGKIAEQQE